MYGSMILSRLWSRINSDCKHYCLNEDYDSKHEIEQVIMNCLGYIYIWIHTTDSAVIRIHEEYSVTHFQNLASVIMGRKRQS